VDGEHFIAAPNSGTALCLASVNLFPSPKSDEPPEAAFTDFDFEQNMISVDPYRYCSRFQPIQNVLGRNLRQPFSRKSLGAVVYIACILDDPPWGQHLNTARD